MHFPQLPPQCLRTPCHRPRTTRIQHPRRGKNANLWIAGFFKKPRHVEASTLRLGKAERLTVGCNGDISGRNKIVSKIKTSNDLSATSTTMAKKPWANHTSHTFRYELFDNKNSFWVMFITCFSNNNFNRTATCQWELKILPIQTLPMYHCRPWLPTLQAKQLTGQGISA